MHTILCNRLRESGNICMGVCGFLFVYVIFAFFLMIKCAYVLVGLFVSACTWTCLDVQERLSRFTISL